MAIRMVTHSELTCWYEKPRLQGQRGGIRVAGFTSQRGSGLSKSRAAVPDPLRTLLCEDPCLLWTARFLAFHMRLCQIIPLEPPLL